MAQIRTCEASARKPLRFLEAGMREVRMNCRPKEEVAGSTLFYANNEHVWQTDQFLLVVPARVFEFRIKSDLGLKTQK